MHISNKAIYVPIKEMSTRTALSDYIPAEENIKKSWVKVQLLVSIFVEID